MRFRDRVAIAHGVAHRPAPGDRRRASSTRSGPTTSTASPCCATRRSRSTTSIQSLLSHLASGWSASSSSPACCWPRSTRRCSCCCWRRPAAGGRRPSAPAAEQARSRSAARRTSAWPATSSSSAPPPAPAKEAAGRPASGRPSRRAAGTACASAGASPIAAARRQSARRGHAAAWAVFGLGLRRRHRGVRGVGLDRSAGDIVLVVGGRRQRCPAYLGQTVGEAAFLRWRLGCDSALRLTVARGPTPRPSRTTPTGDPVPDRLGDGIRLRARPFRYPGTERTALDDVDLDAPRPARSSPWSARTAPARRTLGEAAVPLLPTRRRVASPSTAPTSPGCPARRGGDRLSGAFQDFFRFELRRPPASVGVGRPRSRRRRAGGAGRRSAGPVPTTSSSSLPAGLDTQLGRDVERRRRAVSFGQWQKLAPGPRASCGPSRSSCVLDEPTAALDAETEHALFERYADAAATAAATGASPCSCRTASRRCGWPTRSWWSTAPGCAEAGTHDELMARRGLYAEALRGQASAPGWGLALHGVVLWSRSSLKTRGYYPGVRGRGDVRLPHVSSAGLKADHMGRLRALPPTSPHRWHCEPATETGPRSFRSRSGGRGSQLGSNHINTKYGGWWSAGNTQGAHAHPSPKAPGAWPFPKKAKAGSRSMMTPPPGGVRTWAAPRRRRRRSGSGGPS